MQMLTDSNIYTHFSVTLERNRRAILAILPLSLCLCLLLTVPMLTRTAQANAPKVITAAIPADFPPHYVLKDNIPTGFAIEVMNAIAEKAGYTVSYQIYGNWHETLSALRNKEVDVIPNVGITRRRSEFAEFTSPLETFQISIFIRSASTNITLPSDLVSKRIGVIKANAAFPILDTSKLYQLVPCNSINDLLGLLLSGQVDAIAYPTPLIMRSARLMGVADRIKQFGTPLKEIKRAIAVQRGKTTLLSELDAAVIEYVRTKEFKTIYLKWFGAQPSFWTTTYVSILIAGMIAIFAVIFGIWKYRTTRSTKETLLKNIHERDAAQQELFERENSYRQLVENLHEGIWMSDTEHKTTYVNPRLANMLGYLPEEMLKNEITSFVAPDERERARRHISSLVAGQAGNFQLCLQKKEGKPLPVQLAATPIYSQSGDFKGLLAGVMDISQLKEMEKQLIDAHGKSAAASRIKSEFLAIMSHEIRTPLNGLLGMLQLLEKSMKKNEHADLITSAVLAGRGLVTILDDIFEIAQAESSSVHRIKFPVSLSEIVNTVSTTFLSEAKLKGLSLVTDIDPSVPERILIDAPRLRQILFTLAGNALKFTEQGSITLGVTALPHRPGGQHLLLLFSVSDTGIGFSDKEEDYSFETYSLTLASKSNQVGGTGAGLSIVKRMVSLMGGTMAVETEEGKGTSIYFTVQAGIPDALSKEAPPSPAPTTTNKTIKPLQSPNILIVEDDRLSRVTLERFIAHLGYIPYSVSNGREALEQLSRRDFGCIFMDIQMPYMDGIATTRAIRSDSALGEKRDIPIIALTAYAQKNDRERLLKEGITEYLPKPIDYDVLEQVIQSILKSNTP